MRQVAWVLSVLLIGISCWTGAARAADDGEVIELQEPAFTLLDSFITVIRDGRAVLIDPATLVPETQYVLSIRCLDGAKLVAESGITLRQGYPAIIQNSRSRAGSVNLGLLIVVDAAQARFTAEPPFNLGNDQSIMTTDVTSEAYAVFRDASYVFSYGELKLMVYCPGATSFECRIQRQVTTAPRLMKKRSELLPVYVPGETQPVEWVGSFTAALDCPDLGYVGPDGTVYGDRPPEV